MLGCIDKDNKTEIDNILNYRDYTGRNLLHRAAEATDIDLCKLILSMCQFQKDRNALLLLTDNSG